MFTAVDFVHLIFFIWFPIALIAIVALAFDQLFIPSIPKF